MALATHRRLIWIGIGAVLVAVLPVAAFFAYWYVVWPMPAKWVAIHSPWTAPQIRALGIVHRWGTDLDTVLKGQEIFGKSVPARGLEAEEGILECLRSSDETTQWMGFFVISKLAKHRPLSPAICAEIQRGIQDPDSPVGSVALACVELMPPELAQPILRNFLQAEDPDLRWTGVVGLAKPGAFELSPSVLPWLLEENLRYDAIRLLIKIRDPATIEQVRIYADDPTPHVREAAQFFLNIMTSQVSDPVRTPDP